MPTICWLTLELNSTSESNSIKMSQISLFLNKVNTIYTATLLEFLWFLSSCSPQIPHETGTFTPSNLVELTRLDSSLKLDIRYATDNNFVGRPVYTEARAFLQQPAAQALVRVNEEMRVLGYGLLIFDGYRPWSVTKLFWEITADENKKFVADPKDGSRHNRGCAIDVSLYELESGKEVKMTSEYDEMNESSYPNFTGGTTEQRRMRDLLIDKMKAHGFTVYEFEWWHFDYQGWENFQIQNIPFSAIE